MLLLAVAPLCPTFMHWLLLWLLSLPQMHFLISPSLLSLSRKGLNVGTTAAEDERKEQAMAEWMIASQSGE